MIGKTMDEQRQYAREDAVERGELLREDLE